VGFPPGKLMSPPAMRSVAVTIQSTVDPVQRSRANTTPRDQHQVAAVALPR
jgi:hypothetical protein